ncbi:hypothetical protein ACFY3M_51550 [Streptomyces mirabilis]|uniref:hypothetical protein n=1 Tax=Streptomyces mirabilis TaxID=68239 RepID=UPI0036C23A82
MIIPKRAALAATTVGLCGSLALGTAASATSTPAQIRPHHTTATASAVDLRPATGGAAVDTTQVKRGHEAQASSCIRLWIPYGQKIGGKWYVVAGGRLADCGQTYFKVTLQQKRWWGWDDRSSKTITRSGDANPRAKCKTFGTYKWRTLGIWYHITPRGQEQLGRLITKSWTTRC